MEILVMKRGEGKTTKCALALAKDINTIMIVANSNLKKIVIKDYSGIKNIHKRVFSVDELDKLRGEYQNYNIVIDELDFVLANLIGRKINFATITQND